MLNNHIGTKSCQWRRTPKCVRNRRNEKVLQKEIQEVTTVFQICWPEKAGNKRNDCFTYKALSFCKSSAKYCAEIWSSYFIKD